MLPTRIIMDGGIIQVNSCKEALKDVNKDIKVLGLIKDDNHKTRSLLYEGKEIEMEILFTFEDDSRTKQYVLYTNPLDEEGEVFASTYDNEGHLFPITDEKEWQMVEEVFAAYIKGEDCNRKEQQANLYNHKCSVCGRTDKEHPELEFRYCSKCAGYHCFCQEHIFNHIHFTE